MRQNYTIIFKNSTIRGSKSIMQSVNLPRKDFLYIFLLHKMTLFYYFAKKIR